VTRITLQDGKIVLRDGKAGTEEACCCGGCPPGCPNIDGCTLVVAWVFDDFRLEWINAPLSDFLDPLTCAAAFVVDEDIELENGGTFSGVFRVTYDESCCPTISDVQISYVVDELEEFPGGCNGQAFLNDFGGVCVVPVVELEGCQGADGQCVGCPDGYHLPPIGPAIDWEWNGIGWDQLPNGFDVSACDDAPQPNGGPLEPNFGGAFVGEVVTTGCRCGS
jgi:hypothetical protein